MTGKEDRIAVRSDGRRKKSTMANWVGAGSKNFPFLVLTKPALSIQTIGLGDNIDSSKSSPLDTRIPK